MLEELLEFSNIDNEYITNYLRQDILPKIQKQNYDFDKIFAHLKEGRWNSFNGIDYIYFNVIFEEIEKNSELKEKFINFIYSILCPNRNFNEIEEEMIKQVIFSKMRNKRYVDFIRALVLEDKKPKDIAMFMRITVDNLYNIKKHALDALTKIAIEERDRYENK